MPGGVLYLTIEDVAEYLKIPRETLYKYVRTGRIPASKVGRHWRFARGELDHWVSQQRDRRSPPRLKVLVIDSEHATQKTMARWLGDANCEVTSSSYGQEALALLPQTHFDVIFLDLTMPKANSIETLREMKLIAPTTIVVMVSSFFDGKLLEDVLELGPLMVMKKPLAQLAVTALVTSLATCGRHFNLERTEP